MTPDTSSANATVPVAWAVSSVGSEETVAVSSTWCPGNEVGGDATRLVVVSSAGISIVFVAVDDVYVIPSNVARNSHVPTPGHGVSTTASPVASTSSVTERSTACVSGSINSNVTLPCFGAGVTWALMTWYESGLYGPVVSIVVVVAVGGTNS